MPYGLRGRANALRGQFGADRAAVAPAVLHFALLDGDPTGGGVEPTAAGAYGRAAAANDATLWGTIAAGADSITNAGAEIVWPTSTGLWSVTGQLTWWAVYDNAAGGNLIAYGPLSTPITITGAGDTARIPVGALTLQQEA